MKSIVTIKLKIPNDKLLLDTMKQYSKAISYIADRGFASGIHNRYKLHHLCYYEARNKFNLPSQFVVNANRIASQTLKSVKSNKGSKPIFKEYMPLAFDKRTFTFCFDRVRLTTIKGRIDIPIEIPEYYWKYLDWSWQTALLTVDKKNRMFLHITFSRDINVNKISNGLQVGVDVGINHIAVTSNRQFFSGNKIKSYRLKFRRLRARLQSKGTNSARKLLRKSSGRERRFKAYWNHVISKQIVSGCEAGDTVVLENIKGIRINKGRKFNFWLHGWSFYQLQSFTSYKAMQRGVNVIKVNPFHTSQICSKCGSLGSRSEGFFVCSHCGYSLNADLNASFNLAKHHSMPDGVPLRDAGNPGFPSISVAVTQPHIQSNDAKGTVCATAAELMDKGLHL